MISVKEAKQIAVKEYSEYPVAEILDIGNRWVFCFDTGDPPIPGTGMVTVDKETGEVGWLTIPPLENIALLEAGKVVTE